VARLALELFDASQAHHGLGDDAREILEAAALLCNVGMFLSHAQHHKHSYYVIRGTDRLTGFNDDEVERIALVARYHRKSDPRQKHVEFAAVRDDTKYEVSVLAGLLRIATGLDRNHAARVRAVTVRDSEKGVVVEATPVPGEDIGLELYAAGARAGLLERTLDLKVDVREA